MEHRETERALFRALHRFGKANTGQIVEMEGLTQGEFFGLAMLHEKIPYPAHESRLVYSPYGKD